MVKLFYNITTGSRCRLFCASFVIFFKAFIFLLIKLFCFTFLLLVTVKESWIQKTADCIQRYIFWRLKCMDTNIIWCEKSIDLWTHDCETVTDNRKVEQKELTFFLKRVDIILYALIFLTLYITVILIASPLIKEFTLCPVLPSLFLFTLEFSFGTIIFFDSEILSFLKKCKFV